MELALQNNLHTAAWSSHATWQGTGKFYSGILVETRGQTIQPTRVCSRCPRRPAMSDCGLLTGNLRHLPSCPETPLHMVLSLIWLSSRLTQTEIDAPVAGTKVTLCVITP